MLFAEETKAPLSYQVLARKYRPKTFSDMVGQNILVKTFTNAIKKGRVAHAFILTGIRGVGKTTTARIIARALNCTNLSQQSTAEPCGICENCQTILLDKHQDVIEIDAASHTGVNDIREIIESSRYRPVIGQYKIFIIDEVHMLSTNAFNALLKTLEEPPAHVKFIFATTEIRKIPLTILSRCQRFDLKRVDVETLTDYLQHIAVLENFTIDYQTTKLIASLADGSVRDALSILDQGLSNAENGIVKYETVENMLGMADKKRLAALYCSIVEAKQEEALSIAEKLYADGADPFYIAQELLLWNHTVLKAKVSKQFIESLTETEIQMLGNIPENLNISTILRLHTQINHSLESMRHNPYPFKGLEVMLLKLIYTSNLPPLEQFLQQTNNAAGKLEINNAQEIINLLQEHDHVFLASQVSQYIGFADFNELKINCYVYPEAPKNLLRDLQTTINNITSHQWHFTSIDTQHPSLFTLEKQQQMEQQEKLMQDEGLQAIIATFGDVAHTEIIKNKL